MSQGLPGAVANPPGFMAPPDGRAPNIVFSDVGSSRAPYVTTQSGGYFQPHAGPHQPSSAPPALQTTGPGYTNSQHAQSNLAQQRPQITRQVTFGTRITVPDSRLNYVPQGAPLSHPQGWAVNPRNSQTFYPHTTSMLPASNPTGPNADSNISSNASGHYRPNSSPYNALNSPPSPGKDVMHSNYQDRPPSPFRLIHPQTHPLLSSSSIPQDGKIVSHQKSLPQLPLSSRLHPQRSENISNHNNTISSGHPEHTRPRANTIDSTQYPPPGIGSSIQNLESGFENFTISAPPQPQHSFHQLIQPPNIFVHADKSEIVETTWDWIRAKFLGIGEPNTKLGRGQFGTVYADNTAVNRCSYSNQKYAVKAMDDNQKHRNELKTVLNLCTGTRSGRAHPHIVNVFNTFQVGRKGEDPPQLFIQMELCDGTLGGYLKLLNVTNENLRPKFIFSILLQIAEGLRYCHSKNFIHRDIKPTNVLYSKTPCRCHPPVPERPCYVLTDFGFSRALEGNGYSSDSRGTNGYRAPELLEYKDFSKKTDIWAFGCVIMEVVSSGKCLAFESDTAAFQYSKGEGVQLPQLKPESNELLDTRMLGMFNDLLEKCFYINPQNRPSVEELLRCLTKGLRSIDNEGH